MANSVYVSTVRAYPGLELKDGSLECIEIVSVKDFAGFDDPEGGFCRRLYAPSGVGRTEERGETIAITGKSRCPCRKYGCIIEAGILDQGICAPVVPVTQFTCPAFCTKTGQ